VAYESCVLKGLFVVRWGARPELRDLDAYVGELAAARKTQGAPLVSLFIMPENSAAPDEIFRKQQSMRLGQVMENSSYCIAVFEGSSFMLSLKRSALAAILLFAPSRARVHVRSSVEDALVKDPPGPIGFDAPKAIAELKRRRLC
jgi:hypothetical protein